MSNRVPLALLQQPDFRRLWFAQTVSNAGSGVSSVAIPLTAALGMLRLEVLVVVAFLAGTLTVVFDIAVSSYVPALVARAELVEANGQLQLGTSVTRVAGPGVAGWLVQVVGAPFAVVADALSFLASAALLGRITTAEPAAPTRGDRPSMWREIGEGLQAVWSDAILRWMVVSTAIASFGGSILQAVYVIYVTRALGITPATLGLILASGGLASILGAGLAGTLGRRVGPGVAMVLGQLVVALGTAVIPLSGLRPELTLPLLVLGQVLFSGGLTVFSIN